MSPSILIVDDETNLRLNYRITLETEGYEVFEAASAASALQELLEPLGQRVREPGRGERRLRGLTPLVGQDAALLEAVGRAELTLNGLRNRDLVAALDGQPAADTAARKRRSAQISRQLRLLRAHGLLKKVPKTHRYQVTDRGRLILTGDCFY